MSSHLFLDYLKNFKPAIVEQDRLFGVEVELCLVSLFDWNTINDISVTEHFLLQAAESLEMNVICDQVSGKPIRIESNEHELPYKTIISPDFSTSTIEISTKPEQDLSTLIASVRSLYGDLNKIARRNHLYLVGCGMHPFINPSTCGVYHYNSRYSKVTKKDLPYLICQSFHFTFEVSLERLPETYTVLNKLVPFFTLLFSCSPLYKEKWQGVNSFREKLWFVKSKKDNRYGFGPVLSSVEKHFDQLCSLQMSRIIRNGKYIFLEEKISFSQFVQNLITQKLIDIRNTESRQILMNDYFVFESTVWHNIRIRNKISAIEIRSMDSIPVRYIPSVISFVRGLLVNIEEVALLLSSMQLRNLNICHKQFIHSNLNAISDFEIDFLNQLVKISEQGLKSINQAKCIPYLALIKEMCYTKMNMADRLMQVYKAISNKNTWKDKIFEFLIFEE